MNCVNYCYKVVSMRKRCFKAISSGCNPVYESKNNDKTLINKKYIITLQ